MRAATTFLLLIGAPAASASAAPCTWVETEVPALRYFDGMVLLQRRYTCPADARGTLRVELTAASGGRAIPVGEAEAEIEPRGKWPRSKNLVEKAWPRAFCRLEPARGVKRRLVGFGNDQRLVFDVSVRAQVTGTLDMAALKWDGEVRAPCSACPRARGDIALKDGRAHAREISKRTRISAWAARDWYDCARRSSTLSLRFFVDNEEQRASTRIRPAFALERLERLFTRNKDRQEIEEPVPLAQLCQALGAGTHKLEWELFGNGELMKIGPGRSRIKVSCR